MTIINNYKDFLESIKQTKIICNKGTVLSHIFTVKCSKHDDYNLSCIYCLLDKALTSCEFKIVKKDTTNNQ